MNKKQIAGLIFLLIAIITIIAKFFFIGKESTFQQYSVGLIILFFLIGIVLVFDFTRILFDPEEDAPNLTLPDIIVNIRYRGILYNNIAIILFLITLVIIFMCFYLFFTNFGMEVDTKSDNAWINTISAKVGSSVLLIFLVQILFKIFKYLLRVAAFYNARADAMEFILRNRLEEKEGDPAEKPAIDLNKTPIDLEKLMNMFTPSNYDISELDKISLLDGVADLIKAKVGK